ncbi:hypothetical protein N5923_09700 [Erwiniaceae bacterium BAC15a-03b]|uniref:DUF7480 domain-containing protein n=1 Tax=Winslowiella arboricola TaxID=2978220 RepID=A0A9J6PQ00_9GAMM|nr:putative T6SS immunity periplasmic lipoprotein [Winslowiella arboricola]MCU5773855.1 hypothetical protein [Winslowiella arboricola]MCU5777765.1 hypothetical protein [Winslowiella arboricola]
MAKIVILLLIFLLPGCGVYEKPFYYDANMTLQNNRPCFSVPDDMSYSRQLVGIAIYRRGAGATSEWSRGFSDNDLYEAVISDHCIDYDYPTFISGEEYRVLIVVMSPERFDTKRRYLKDFTYLQR